MSHTSQENEWNQQHPEERQGSARAPLSALALLEEIFTPNRTHLRAFRDAVIVSLELEYNSNLPSISQIGLTILDTRKLASIDIDDFRSITSAVSNHLFVLKKKPFRKYCYGDPGHVKKGTSLDQILRPFLAMKNDKGQPRNIVLVGHSIHVDMKVLKSCGLDMNNLVHVTAYIDIAPAGSYFFSDGIRRLSLKRICQRLRIRTFSYHNAAHDSLYTLQALLLIFCSYKKEKMASLFSNHSISHHEEQEDQTILWGCQIEALQFIGEELGNALWVGTPANRRRRQQSDDYIRRVQLDLWLDSLKLESSGQDEHVSPGYLQIGDALLHDLEGCS